MKIFKLNLLATMILVAGAFAFTACSSSDDNGGKTPEPEEETLSIEKLAGLWVTDYAQSGTEGDKSWTRVVEDILFRANGTGYYECYRLNGEKFVNAVSVRDNGALHYTISGNTVTITGDENNMTQTLTYADGKLTMVNGQSSMVNRQFSKATTEQQTLVNQLYADWQAGNSGGDDDDDNNLDDVDGNVDINNGGGGVNVVR